MAWNVVAHSFIALDSFSLSSAVLVFASQDTNKPYTTSLSFSASPLVPALGPRGSFSRSIMMSPHSESMYDGSRSSYEKLSRPLRLRRKSRYSSVCGGVGSDGVGGDGYSETMKMEPSKLALDQACEDDDQK